MSGRKKEGEGSRRVAAVWPGGQGGSEGVTLEQAGRGRGLAMGCLRGRRFRQKEEQCKGPEAGWCLEV